MCKTDYITEAMRRRGIQTYGALERLAGISHSDLWRIRKGGDARTSTLRRIAEALEISVTELLDGQERPKTSLERPYRCPVCEGRQFVGTGMFQGTTEVETKCQPCEGTGVLWRSVTAP